MAVQKDKTLLQLGGLNTDEHWFYLASATLIPSRQGEVFQALLKGARRGTIKPCTGRQKDGQG